jgi:hypothetical protein
MLEPRVVALAPAPSAWDLDLSYQSADSTNLGAPQLLETAVRNDASTLSTNEEDGVLSLAMEDEGRSYSEEGINNEDANHSDTPIEDEFSDLATTLRSLGRDRTQKLVGNQMILAYCELISTYVDCYALCWNL